MTLLQHLAFLDLVALALFAATLLGYGPAIARFGGTRAVNRNLTPIRRRWMTNVLTKENRIADAQMIGHVISSASFFASTSMLLIAGMLGILGSVTTTHAVVQTMSFVPPTDIELFELKIILLLIVLVSGFFRFSHAIRQFNYAIALIGSAPPQAMARDEAERRAAPIATVMNNALHSFNTGVRTYYFAFAVLGWLLGPLAFIAITIYVFLVLLFRQTHSGTSKAIRDYSEL
ncbi:DUF599 domain-containing protein [Marinivivus vitaminiproducens]|uniref:DUF599 domain-containing protein n=1 Tax=Marinivivus vitaminiproducens TaxID=3035935 RepID=UPI0027A8DDFE|nr:DUF599 family protein [Geminicoccaceae bacterium SCSIO 64248]